MEQPNLSELLIAAPRILALNIQDECLPGVQASLDLLESHASILRSYVSSLNDESKYELKLCEGAH